VVKARAKLTINDIARMAGVSKKTVSRVINRSPDLNAGTRQRVDDLIAALGYVPNPQARALASGRNFLIGLVHGNPNAQTVMNVQHGMLEALHDTEFEMVVRPIDGASPTLLADLRTFIERQRLFGVVLMPPLSEDDAVASLCRETGCRYARLGPSGPDAPDDMVTSNDRAAVREATDYLISLGHRRIALVEGPRDFRSARERRAGFEQALAEAGIAVPRSMVAEGDYRFESGLLAGDRLLTSAPRPTAIFCCNDEMAAGVIHAAGRLGLDVPGDVSVIGFDDTPTAAHVWPPLTTVRWPIATMARAATLRLIAANDRDADNGLLFPSTLIRRASVAPPAAIPGVKPCGLEPIEEAR
jgi:LacI family transcriptional regulator